MREHQSKEKSGSKIIEIEEHQSATNESEDGES